MNSTQSKMARAAFDLTVNDLARMAGVGRMSIIRFEAGGNVAPETRAKIETALAETGAAFTRRAGRVGVTVPE